MPQYHTTYVCKTERKRKEKISLLRDTRQKIIAESVRLQEMNNFLGVDLVFDTGVGWCRPRRRARIGGRGNSREK